MILVQEKPPRKAVLDGEVSQPEQLTEESAELGVRVRVHTLKMLVPIGGKLTYSLLSKWILLSSTTGWTVARTDSMELRQENNDKRQNIIG